MSRAEGPVEKNPEAAWDRVQGPEKTAVEAERTEQGGVCALSEPQFPSLRQEGDGSASRLSSELPLEQAVLSKRLGEQWEALRGAWPKLLTCDLGHVPFPFTPWG